MDASLLKHAWVVAEGLEVKYLDPLVLGMCWIDEEIIFCRRKDRGHKQQAILAFLHEFIAKTRQFRRSGGIAPVCRQLPDSNLVSHQIGGNFRNRQHKIGGEIVLIEVNEIFQHSQRLMF